MKKEFLSRIGLQCIVILLFISSLVFAENNHSNNYGSSLKVLKEQSFKTTPGKNFILKASSGDVFISTNNSPYVYIKILGNEKAEKNFNFEFDNSSDGITVTAHKKSSWNIFNLFSDVRLKFEITLPNNYNADISSSGGDINLSDLTGNVKLKTSGGDVEAAKINGKLDVSTSGGDISLENINGDELLGTSGGDVKSIEFKGNINASTSGGDIILRGSDGKINAGTSGGEINLNYSGENLGIKLSSSGGDVTIKLPNDFNAYADLHASGGDINCSFKANNVKKISSSKYEADLNNGGNSLYVRTSGGDINIEQR